MKFIKSYVVCVVLLLCILSTFSIIYASDYSATVILPDSGKYAVSFESIKEGLLGSDFCAIDINQEKKVFVLKSNNSEDFNVYYEKNSLKNAEADGNDLIFHLDTGPDFSTGLIFDLPISDIAYELEIYYETSKDTYAHYISNISIYNFGLSNNSLKVPLDIKEGKRYKIVFVDALLKLDTISTINIEISKQNKEGSPNDEVIPVKVYEKNIDENTYEYLFDFGTMTFIDSINVVDKIIKLSVSKDSQIFSTASVTDIGNGLYTRFLIMQTTSPLTNELLFLSYKRYLIFEGNKSDVFTFGINIGDHNNLSDIEVVEGDINDYRIITADLIESNEKTDSYKDYVPQLIFLAVIIFLLYPGYLLFKYLRSKFIR